MLKTGCKTTDQQLGGFDENNLNIIIGEISSCKT